MHSPLALLMWLRIRGWARRLRGAGETRRGRIYLILGIGLILLMFLPTLTGAAVRPEPDLQQVRRVAPLVMLGLTVLICLGSGAKVIGFTPPEVEFLFPGPFTRRRLLLYKLSFTALGSLLTALILTLWQGRHAGSWLAAYLGLYVTVLFAAMVGIVTALLRRAALDSRSSVAVRAGAWILAAFAIVGLATMVYPMARDGVLLSPEAIDAARRSWFGRIVLAPFDVMTYAFTAERIFPDLALWFGVSLAMIALLAGLALRLEEHFVEASLAASRRLEARLARRRTGPAFVHATSGPVKRSLPALPRMGGAGSIAWRQLLNAMRSSRGILLFLAIMAAASGPAVWGAVRVGSDAAAVGAAAGFTLMWLVLFLPMMLRFDFRSDVDQMDVLKSLPISPMAMVTGQLIAPTVVMTLTVVVLGGMLALFLPPVRIPLWASLPFVPVLAALLFAVENTLFLLAPARTEGVSPGDIQGFGRALVSGLAKGGLLAAVAVAAAATGGPTYALTGAFTFSLALRLVVTGIVVWLTLGATVYLMLRIAARLYAGFDPGVHAPA